MNEKIIIKANGESIEITPSQLPVETLHEQAIKSSLNLLDLENVAYIIYVDDKFDIAGQREEFKALLTNLKNNSNYIRSEKFSTLNWDDPDPKFEIELLELWDNSEKKEELLLEACRHINDNEVANVIPVLEMRNYYGDRIKTMTPDAWVESKYSLIKELNEGQKALCLFDFEFQNGNKLLEGKNGAQLAQILIEQKEFSDRIICGIFSHKFSEQEEDAYRIEYAKRYAIEKKKFYTISKLRFAFDPRIIGFAEGIKNLLLHPHVEKLKEESLAVLKKSHNKAAEKISDISPRTFNQIIQKSSLKEGVWEVTTIFRLFGILSKEENFNTISDHAQRQAFNDSIDKIREIDLIETGYSATSKNEQLTNLRNSELYLPGTIINKLHLPLSNGDIFKIKGKEYILLVQPCNLALRAKEKDCGKRDYGYDTGMLVPLKYIEKDRLNITNEEVKVAEVSDKFYSAYFPGFQIVSLNILDLVVFNEDGKALIDMNTSELDNAVIHYPWKKRYEDIYKVFTSYETKIMEFKPVKAVFEEYINQKKQELKRVKETGVEDNINNLSKEIGILKNNLKNSESNILSVEDIKRFKLDCSKIYNVNSRIFDMNIERIKHYKSPYSDDLLQKFMLYLSRNAFEHDFTTN